MREEIRELTRIIRDSDGFLVASHENPDGDAIGSTVALGWVLAGLGKRVVLCNAAGMPERFAWLAAPGPVLAAVPQGEFSWGFVLDSGSLARVGERLAPSLAWLPLVNIDHHLGNRLFGALNWVDQAYSSVGAMIADLARELGIPLSGPLGEAVYLAVTTDTGFFTFGNTTPQDLELAAELLRQGLSPGEVNAKTQNQWTVERMRLWAEAMGRIELPAHGTVALVCVTREMLERTNTGPDDCENLVNFLRRLRCVRVAAILREDGPELVKFSLRSQGADNVQAVAAAFGGGGHRNAAGGTIAAGLAPARERLLAALGETLGLV